MMLLGKCPCSACHTSWSHFLIQKGTLPWIQKLCWLMSQSQSPSERLPMSMRPMLEKRRLLQSSECQIQMLLLS